MKKLLLSFTVAVTQMAMAQSIKLDRPVLDGEARAVVADTEFFAEGIHSGKSEYNTIKYEIGMLVIKANTLPARKKLEINSGDRTITMRLNLKCMHEMYISKGNTVMFKLKNGTNLQFKTLDNIDKSYDAQRLGQLSGWYRNTIEIDLSLQQLRALINGMVVKIRVVDDLTNKHDANVEGNLFSSLLEKEYKLIDDRLNKNDDAEGF